LKSVFDPGLFRGSQSQDLVKKGDRSPTLVKVLDYSLF